MRYELKVILPISAENAGLINIVAGKAGWVDGMMNVDGTPRTANQVCQEIMAKFIAGTVSDAFDWFYGASQKATREQILQIVGANLTVSLDPVNEP